MKWLMMLIQLITSPTGPWIVNFDKLLTGEDKIINVYPPPNTTWIILQGSIDIETGTENGGLKVWIEDAPYAPYRDPTTHEMVGCPRCLTLMSEDASRAHSWRLEGVPITVSWPNRLCVAVTPVHGGLPQPVQVRLRLQVTSQSAGKLPSRGPDLQANQDVTVSTPADSSTPTSLLLESTDVKVR